MHTAADLKSHGEQRDVPICRFCSSRIINREKKKKKKNEARKSHGGSGREIIDGLISGRKERKNTRMIDRLSMWLIVVF